MLQFPAFMTQFPSTEKTSPATILVQNQSKNLKNDDELLTLEEANYKDMCNEIKKMNSNAIVIGKIKIENDKEDVDNDAEEEDDADHAEESEGEFEQETA